MNGKKARAIRKMVGSTAAKASDYVRGSDPVMMDISKLPTAPMGMPPTFVMESKGVPTRLRPASARRLYKLIKKHSHHVAVL